MAGLEPLAPQCALEDVSTGDGSELRQPKDPRLHPRFHSARSSCALAVNAFGYWRCDPTTLVVAGTGGYQQLRFEAKFPIAGSGRRIPPNIDVHATGSSESLAVESKLLEYLSTTKPVSIADEYDRAIIDFTKAIAIEPKEAAFYNNRGLAWYFKGEYERAISDLTLAILLEPGNSIAQFNLEAARKASND